MNASASQASASPPGADRCAAAPATRADWIPLLLAVVIDVPLLFLGYGADSDSYRVLDCARALLDRHIYAPSRNPGYLVYECVTAVLDRIGGSLLTNFGTLCASLLIVACFLRVCRRFQIPHRVWLGVLLVVHPLFWINSTCTIDYNWGQALVWCGLVCVLEGWFVVAGVLLGLALGTRLSCVAFVGAIWLYALATFPGRRRRIFAAGALTGLLGALCYLPSYRWAGNTFDFLQPHINRAPGAWTWQLRIGRWGYRNLFFWSLAGGLMLLPMIAIAASNWKDYLDRRWRPLLIFLLAALAAQQTLFFLYPLHREYLLPTLPIVLILLGIGLQRHPRWLYALIVPLLLASVVEMNVLKANQKSKGTAAGFHYGLFWERGILVGEIRDRWDLLDCDTVQRCDEIHPPPWPPED